MNRFTIASGEVRIFTVPLKEPFITALGRKDATTNVSVELRLKGGARGWGEASGSIVMAAQKPPRLAAVLRRLLARFHGWDVRRTVPLAAEVWRSAHPTPAAAAAFECAALDALLSALRVPMHDWLGGAQDRIETDLTLSAGTLEATRRAARRAAGEGFRQLKVKVGKGGFAEDLGRALAADEWGRRRGRRPEILLDGNQGLTHRSAMRLAEACLKEGLRVVLFEQPVPREKLKELARLKRDCPVPLAADESLRGPEDALRLIELDAADVFNIKVAKTGLQASLQIVALAKAAGKKLMIGCMQETARGLEPSVSLACGTGAFSFADLDSDWLLGPGQPAGRFRREGAWLRV